MDGDARDRTIDRSIRFNTPLWTRFSTGPNVARGFCWRRSSGQSPQYPGARVAAVLAEGAQQSEDSGILRATRLRMDELNELVIHRSTGRPIYQSTDRQVTT